MSRLKLFNASKLFDLSYLFWWMLKNKCTVITYQKNSVIIDGEIFRYNDAAKIFSDKFFLKNESGFTVRVTIDELIISKE